MYIILRRNNGSSDLWLMLRPAAGQRANFVANLPQFPRSHLMPVDCRRPEELFEPPSLPAFLFSLHLCIKRLFTQRGDGREGGFMASRLSSLPPSTFFVPAQPPSPPFLSLFEEAQEEKRSCEEPLCRLSAESSPSRGGGVEILTFCH